MQVLQKPKETSSRMKVNAVLRPSGTAMQATCLCAAGTAHAARMQRTSTQAALHRATTPMAEAAQNSTCSHATRIRGLEKCAARRLNELINSEFYDDAATWWSGCQDKDAQGTALVSLSFPIIRAARERGSHWEPLMNANNMHLAAATWCLHRSQNVFRRSSQCFGLI